MFQTFATSKKIEEKTEINTPYHKSSFKKKRIVPKPRINVWIFFVQYDAPNYGYKKNL